MRTFITLTIAVALLVSVTPVMAQNAADEAAILKATEQYIAAWNANDAKAVLGFNDENCKAWNGDSCNAARMERQKNSRVKLVEEMGVHFITPDVAVHKYVLEVSGWLEADGSTSPPSHAQRSRVYVKRNGKWSVATYIIGPEVEPQ